MSRHAAIEQEFGDGTYTFRLGLGEIEELERKRDAGIFEITTRLRNRTCRLADVLEVLRVGLIGGGMKPVDALALTRRYVDERPLDESRDAAYAVGLAAMMRLHGDQISGEGVAAEANVSTSPLSTETRS